MCKPETKIGEFLSSLVLLYKKQQTKESLPILRKWLEENEHLMVNAAKAGELCIHIPEELALLKGAKDFFESHALRLDIGEEDTIVTWTKF